jgi:hypothetical protein
MFITIRDEGGDSQVPIVPPNTRAPSPDRALPYAEAVPPERDRLPYAEPIPPEHKTRAEPWIEASHWFTQCHWMTLHDAVLHTIYVLRVIIV